ncbi:MAG: DUF5800 family protein [Halobacteria archaeon]|nr:DUF5800 family protein [Halobacteria archaeon]
MTRVEHSGTVFEFDEEGVDVTWDGHEFRMRRRVVERAADKEYLDVTDHEVLRMIDREHETSGPARRIGDIL